MKRQQGSCFCCRFLSLVSFVVAPINTKSARAIVSVVFEACYQNCDDYLYIYSMWNESVKVIIWYESVFVTRKAVFGRWKLTNVHRLLYQNENIGNIFPLY